MLIIKESINYKNREKKKKFYPRDTKVQANNPACLDELKYGLLCPYKCITRGNKKLFKNVWQWYSHILIHRSTVADKFETNEEFRLKKQNEIKYQKSLAAMILTLIIAGVIPIK